MPSENSSSEHLVLKDGESLIGALDRDAEERGLDEEPPLTPEEEERLAAYEHAVQAEHEEAAEPPPPQPEWRPPYTVAYAVQGHLYEVAIPGDATAQAVDGALIITHGLGPIAGIVRVMPMQKEAS